jgi:hypothetical protein
MNMDFKSIGKTALIALVVVVAYGYIAPKLMKGKGTPAVTK